MKKVDITLEQARDYCNNRKGVDDFILQFFTREELEGKEELTKKWEELGNLYEFSMGGIAEWLSQLYFATESQARSALAFAQLSQIAKECNDRVGFVADWGNIQQEKWAIQRIINDLEIFSFLGDFYHITFHSREAAEESLVKHAELWRQYWEL